MTLKVIGAGFGRTGTTSLKEALEALGFDKCYHMGEVFENDGHAKFWYEASIGQPVNWDELFAGYQATLDWPACTFYKELMVQYPDAKVLLTVRDPERWYDSVFNTIHRMSQILPGWLGWFSSDVRLGMNMFHNLVWKETFHGKFTDKQYTIDIFNQHIAEVKRIVPPERLLVYEVKQGWEPLCDFLNLPIPPDKPFPHANDREQFQQIIKQYSRLRFVSAAVGLLLLLVAVWWMRRGDN